MTHPPVFYKYLSADTAALVLRTGRLRWSSPLLFNDPAEFQRMPRFDPSLAAAHELLPQTITRVVFGEAQVAEERLGAPMKLLLLLVRKLVGGGVRREDLAQLLKFDRPDADSFIDTGLREHFEALDISKARVLCVTTSVYNDAMWGTYAHGHTGVVLGLRHLPELSTPLVEARPVAYTAEPPIVGSGLDFLLYGQNAPNLTARTLDAVCFSKKLPWAYEQEWRAMTWRPDEDKQFGDYKFYPEELESVTFGARMTEDARNAIKVLVAERYRTATPYQMSAQKGALYREVASAA